MEDYRPDPDLLLRQMSEQEKESMGKLKIFFGYAAGVGKTYAMLEAAHEAKAAGVDVVAGYIEPHTRPETMALLDGLELLPAKNVPYKNITLWEFDLDAALARRPALILVDELAHTNAPGCRHTKRYQDIEELQKAGIDVYTTVNVQHVESLHDIVASVTGVSVQERIPDFMFDGAAQVELVDIEPAELIERLKYGKIYQKGQAQNALGHFFTEKNLTALREIALRRMADQVNRVTEKTREQNRESGYYTGEHILVCLSPSPSNAKVIRAAARMAKAFRARFSAVHVELPGVSVSQGEDAVRLRKNQKLAEQLGANTVTLYGGDITRQIAEYARVSGVSKIVLGRSYTKRGLFGKNENFADQLTALLPTLEIFLIPDAVEKPYRKKKVGRETARGDGNPSGSGGRGTAYGVGRGSGAARGTAENSFAPGRLFLRDLGVMIGVLLTCTLIAVAFRALGFAEANIVTVYMLGVLLAALITESQVYSLVVSIGSVLCFNLFFIVPYKSLEIYDPGYLITFLVMFLVGFIISLLAKRQKSYGRQAVKKAWLMEILLDTSRQLQMAGGKQNTARIVCVQLKKLLGRDIVFYPEDPKDGKKPWCYPKEKDSHMDALLTADEAGVAAWSWHNNKHAGASTSTLPGANGFYLAVRSETKVYGVVGIFLGKEFLSAFEENLLSSILNEAGFALEKETVLEEQNRAKAQMRQERVRNNLLRSISCDLRAPLAGITGNCEILKKEGAQLAEEEKSRLYGEIYQDSVWLYNLSENLRTVAGLEGVSGFGGDAADSTAPGSGGLELRSVLLWEVIQKALERTRREKQNRSIGVRIEPETLRARMDEKLIVQVIVNLVDNAIKYTPDHTRIEIAARRYGDRAYIIIADNGEGMPENQKKQILDPMYAENCREPDTGRGLGVGLVLCRSVIEAHGGTLKIRDNVPKGSRFIFDLKAEE